MSMITSNDGTEIYYKDWGPKNAQPIVFHHGWPLSSDDWDTQMLYFLDKGYRVIAHDRRGHGRSAQVSDGHDMDHYAADAAAVVEHLDLRHTDFHYIVRDLCLCLLRSSMTAPPCSIARATAIANLALSKSDAAPPLRPAKYRAPFMKALATLRAGSRPRGRGVSHVDFAKRSRCCLLILSAFSGSTA
jgi:alpha-beta hydrolase superfamily lysophospholipase